MKSYEYRLAFEGSAVIGTAYAPNMHIALAQCMERAHEVFANDSETRKELHGECYRIHLEGDHRGSHKVIDNLYSFNFQEDFWD